jgi:hypothetical protein
MTIHEFFELRVGDVFYIAIPDVEKFNYLNKCLVCNIEQGEDMYILRYISCGGIIGIYINNFTDIIGLESQLKNWTKINPDILNKYEVYWQTKITKQRKDQIEIKKIQAELKKKPIMLIFNKEAVLKQYQVDKNKLNKKQMMKKYHPDKHRLYAEGELGKVQKFYTGLFQEINKIGKVSRI